MSNNLSLQFIVTIVPHHHMIIDDVELLKCYRGEIFLTYRCENFNIFETKLSNSRMLQLFF